MKKLFLKAIMPVGVILLAAASPALAQQKKVAIANMGPHGSPEQVLEHSAMIQIAAMLAMEPDRYARLI